MGTVLYHVQPHSIKTEFKTYHRMGMTSSSAFPPRQKEINQVSKIKQHGKAYTYAEVRRQSGGVETRKKRVPHMQAVDKETEVYRTDLGRRGNKTAFHGKGKKPNSTRWVSLAAGWCTLSTHAVR